jgi:hypothetical protein
MPGGAVTAAGMAVIGAAAVGAGVASAWALAPALRSVSPLVRAGGGPYGYGPYYGAYGYGGDCVMRRRWVVNRYGHRVLRWVRTCY